MTPEELDVYQRTTLDLCAAIRAAWGERDALRDAITSFTGVLVADSGTVLSPRVRRAVDALSAVAAWTAPAREEVHDG